MRLKRILVITLTLLLPLTACAENVVVPLPTAAVPVVSVAVQSNDYAIDLEGYYSESGLNDFADQAPVLTDEEKARVPDLLARYSGGERPLENVLDKTENVTVGVYALDPAQYQGENVFLLIPGREMTDEELLEIIDGYAQLGLTFDPAGLSWRCCMRGGGIESTRGRTGEEADRSSALAELYRRQGLRPERAFTPSPSDDGVGEVMLNPEEYAGLEGFRFTPARPLTDEELLEKLHDELGDEREAAGDYSANEQLARGLLHDLLGAPLSITRAGEWFGSASEYCLYNDDREVYNGGFTMTDGDGWDYDYTARVDIANGTLYSADMFLIDPDKRAFSDLHLDPFDQRWLDLARGYITAMRSDGMGIITLESRGEIAVQYGGYGVGVLAVMADGSSYDMTILYQDDALEAVEYRAIAVTQEQIDASFADFLQ